MSKAGQPVPSTLRQMIMSGELAAGERLAEIPTSERLGASRTPVRIAFRALCRNLCRQNVTNGGAALDRGGVSLRTGGADVVSRWQGPEPLSGPCRRGLCLRPCEWRAGFRPWSR
ncbi:GntR family transcriptional regulator [Marinobacterium aestuariivivens]|uniref:GntR family transcriptional regulator n=1 Tax=Marinobacterium aestuariivivens TaxID=1698799 RepID=A0ABW2A7C6_9GAMM